MFNRTASQTVRTSTFNSVSSTINSLANPLDQLSADQIAYQAAQAVKLPELTVVRNQADSSTAILAMVANDETTLAKPQVVGTAQKSHLDIVHHKVVHGDTVTSLANQYHVSGNSIRWSNDITGDNLTLGATIIIPPGNGLVYKVAATDTIDSIVDRFSANRNTFVTVNDAENGNIRAGQLVWIPNAVKPAAVTLTTTTTLNFHASTFSPTRGGAYFWTAGWEPNGYDSGWCTWWAAHRYNETHPGHPLPQNLGNAFTWGSASGSLGNHQPRAGAAVQFAGRNHVGFVEKVDGDKVTISEMNAVGWNYVDTYVTTMAQARNDYYIY